MKMTKQQKKDKSKELAKMLKGISHLYFTEYRGLKFKDMGDLREQLRPLNCKYNVLKNSMLKHALEQAGIEVSRQDLFNGPMAVLFVAGEDPVSPARILEKFGKENENLKVRAGWVDGTWLDAAACRKMSTLGTKREMLGVLANQLYSATASVAWVMNAPMQKLAGTMKALADKMEKDGTGQ